MTERTVLEEVKGEGKLAGVVIAKLYSDGTVLAKRLRASYPHCGKAWKSDDDADDKPAAYSLVGLAPKDTHKPLMRLLKRLKDEMLKEKKVKALPAEKFYLRDGDQSGKETNEGMYTISTRESKRPKVRNAKGQRITDPDAIEELIYGGAIVNILIRPWWQDHKSYGKRVNAGLSAVQFVLDDGVRFGQGGLSDDDVDDTFGDEEEDGDEVSGFDDDDDGDL